MALPGERQSLRHVAARRKHVTAHHCTNCQPDWKSLLDRNCSRFLQLVECSLLIATEKVQPGSIRQRKSKAVRVAQSSTPEHRLLGPRPCLVLVAKQEEIVSQETERTYLDVNGRSAWREPVRLGSIDGKHTLQMVPGRGKFSQKMQRETHRQMTKQHRARVIVFLGEP